MGCGKRSLNPVGWVKPTIVWASVCLTHPTGTPLSRTPGPRSVSGFPVRQFRSGRRDDHGFGGRGPRGPVMLRLELGQGRLQVLGDRVGHLLLAVEGRADLG